MNHRPQAWLGLAFFAAVAVAHNAPHLAPGAWNWAEAGNIATALLQGRGFSDPFGGGTGATAWIPPLAVWIETGVFALAGVKTAAAAVSQLSLAVLGLAATHALLLDSVGLAQRDRAGGPWFARTTGIAFLILAGLLPGGPLEVQSEAWLDLLLSALLLWSALATVHQPNRRSACALVAVAILAPLADAGLALAAAVTLTILVVRQRRLPQPSRVPLLAGAALVAAVGLWTARNAAALGKFVPLKSNFWFELHLANIGTPLGHWRAETALTRLPFFNTAEFNRYAALGEMRYVETFRAPAIQGILAEPARFATNVAYRLQTALAFCQSEDGMETTRHPFPAGDLERLTAGGELLSLDGRNLSAWIKIDAAPSAAHRGLSALGLTDFPGAWEDWTHARARYNAQYRSPSALLWAFLIAGFPVLAFLGAGLARGGSLGPSAAWALLVAACMLAPFVLVNHGIRHQIPILGMAAVGVGACVQAWVLRAQRPAA